MTTLSTRARPERKTWTVADLYRRFGPIPFERIRQNPPPGTGTVADVDRLNNHEDRLYELVDGILVEKTVGLEESRIAVKIRRLLAQCLRPARDSESSPERTAQSSSTSTWFEFPTCRSSRGNACREVRFPKSRFPSSSPTWSSRSSAEATPPRKWRISSRSISRKAFAWSGTSVQRPESSTSTRRLTTLPD